MSPTETFEIWNYDLKVIDAVKEYYGDRKDSCWKFALSHHGWETLEEKEVCIGWVDFSGFGEVPEYETEYLIRQYITVRVWSSYRDNRFVFEVRERDNELVKLRLLRVIPV